MAAKERVGSCPMDSVLRTLMGPWTSYILWILRSEGPQRFTELKRKVAGVSAKVLTERLRMLEAARLVARDYVPTIPPQVTYSLAQRGDELSPILDAINRVALKWAEEDPGPSAPPRAADGEVQASVPSRQGRESAMIHANPSERRPHAERDVSP